MYMLANTSVSIFRQGTTALFWGPSGTGRSRSAEAVGFELGKPLKVVDLPRLLSGRQGGHGSNDDSGAQAARTIFQVRVWVVVETPLIELL